MLTDTLKMRAFIHDHKRHSALRCANACRLMQRRIIIRFIQMDPDARNLARTIQILDLVSRWPA